jgi:hypothetical protein
MLPALKFPRPSSFSKKALFVVVDPVELWATRQRRPSASGKSTG